MPSALALERQGPLGLVTLNRPERHNAFDDAIVAELTEALRFAEQVTMSSLVGRVARLAVHGPEAAGVLGDAAALAPAKRR